jgi:hypothetical protein
MFQNKLNGIYKKTISHLQRMNEEDQHHPHQRDQFHQLFLQENFDHHLWNHQNLALQKQGSRTLLTIRWLQIFS